MKWISLLLLILFSGTLLAIPPMPEWIQPDQEKKKTSGSSTVSSRTFVIKLEEQNTIIDQQPVDWDYKPSCASFLKCDSNKKSGKLIGSIFLGFLFFLQNLRFQFPILKPDFNGFSGFHIFNRFKQTSVFFLI